MVPYFVVFSDPEDTNVYVEVFNGFIDVFFLSDVVINFRTSFVDPVSAEEITDCKRIAIQYLKTRFMVDFVASIPFDYFGLMFTGSDDNTFILQLFSLLKLVRVLRLGRLITHLNLKNEVKNSLKLGKLLFFIILFIHFLGCAWFMIAKQDEEWIPPLDYVFITTEIYDEGSFMQYCSSAYHAVLMLGGNDIGPRGEFQLIFVSGILLIGAIINSIIFGNMAVVLQSLNRKSTVFQEKLEKANEAMENLKMPDFIREEVEFYLSYTQSGLDHQKELDAFLLMLSPSLKKKVSAYIFKDAIFANPVFKDQDEVMKLLLLDLQVRLFLPEDEIIRQNEVGESMFFLARGQCEVFVTDENKTESFAGTLETSAYFGEIALIKNCKRTASVFSKSYTTIAELYKDNFQRICLRYPSVFKHMERRVRKVYNDKYKKFIKRSIKNIDYLSHGISDKIIDEISYMFELVGVDKNNYLFK